MPLYLLLNSDANLQAELESCLGGISPKPTLVEAATLQEVESCLDSLRDVKGVLVDAENFDPPREFPYPILLLGEPENSRNPYPSLKRPLHPDSLAFALDDLGKSSASSSGQTSSESLAHLDFLSGLIGEIVHDLNNQFTTLRGNLLLLQELYPQEEETFSDMQHATDRSSSLIHLLETLNPDTLPAPEIFTLNLLLDDFFHFAKKLYPATLTPDFSQRLGSQPIHGDSGRLCNLLLQLLWLFSPDFPDVTLSTRQKEKSIEILFTPNHLSHPEELEVRIKQLAAHYHPRDVKLYIEKKSLISSLPIYLNS